MCIRDRRECEDSLSVEGEKRANFSCEMGEENASLVLLEDKGSSLVFVKDKRSLNYFGVSGKARRCNNVVLPSVWNENVKCCEKHCNESDYERERMVEIFKLNRNHEILVQNLCMEREEQIDLPVKREFDNYFDEYDEKINYLILYKNSDGGFTNNTDAVSYTHLDVYKRQGVIVDG